MTASTPFCNRNPPLDRVSRPEHGPKEGALTIAIVLELMGDGTKYRLNGTLFVVGQNLTTPGMTVTGHHDQIRVVVKDPDEQGADFHVPAHKNSIVRELVEPAR